jgi:hypothetical protein
VRSRGLLVPHWWGWERLEKWTDTAAYTLWRLQQVLREGPLTIVEIANRLDGTDADSIARTVRRYEGKTFVRHIRPDGVTSWANLARREA